MALFQVHKPPSSSSLPCTSTTLFVTCLLHCSFLTKQCKCYYDPDNLVNPNLSSAFDQLPGYLFVGSSSSPCIVGEGMGSLWGGLRCYKETVRSDADLDQTGMLFPLYFVDSGMFFRMDFTMSIYERPDNQIEETCRLVFIIKPASHNNHESYRSLLDMLRTNNNTYTIPSNPTPDNVSGSNVSVQISTEDRIAPDIWVQISLERTANSSVANRYIVSIDYTEDGMLIYAGANGEGRWKFANATANVILKRPWLINQSVSFGFFSSMGQLLQLDTWNFETLDPQSDYGLPEIHGNQWAIAWCSVLGSAAAAAITATVVYLNSKYRRWKTEQDKLIKTMRSLPGVPTQVGYAEIRKATKNFHGTMKLGKGGFGAVYRCTLPAAASRTGEAMEVAVKKFLREVEQRRYDDFLAEVSIINRLRHKNIVPLIGWSYNMGEPILIYEYMKNGSLDQHLFLDGDDTRQRQQQQEEASIGKWQTRYSIVRDIAVGLHYVHHEHEPMVLHRDIKASNIMLDSTFGARLGDFGIASTVAVDRSSVTGLAGTWGYIAPEYAMSYRSTRQTDTYAFGVLILEVVTGKKNGDVPPDDDHITGWVWRLHKDGKLLEAVNEGVLAAEDDEKGDAVVEEAERLLLLGLACTNPNPSNRPSIAEAVQVITKLAPPPDVPLERPTFMWPPEDWRLRKSIYSTAFSNWEESSGSTFEIVQVSQELPSSSGTAEHVVALDSTATSASHGGSVTFTRSEKTERSV